MKESAFISEHNTIATDPIYLNRVQNKLTIWYDDDKAELLCLFF